MEPSNVRPEATRPTACAPRAGIPFHAARRPAPRSGRKSVTDRSGNVTEGASSPRSDGQEYEDHGPTNHCEQELLVDEAALKCTCTRPERAGPAHQRGDETVDSPLVEAPRG